MMNRWMFVAWMGGAAAALLGAGCATQSALTAPTVASCSWTDDVGCGRLAGGCGKSLEVAERTRLWAWDDQNVPRDAVSVYIRGTWYWSAVHEETYGYLQPDAAGNNSITEVLGDDGLIVGYRRPWAARRELTRFSAFPRAGLLDKDYLANLGPDSAPPEERAPKSTRCTRHGGCPKPKHTFDKVASRPHPD
jgi:hypothetical protein